MPRTNNSSAPRSWTMVHFLPGDFSGFRAENLIQAAFPGAVFRVKDQRRQARLTSPEIATLFPFDQLLLSANVVFPSGGELEAQARAKTPLGWSPWFSWGTFRPGGSASRSTENRFGRMETDVLKLARKASAFRYRLLLRPKGPKPPLLRLAAACYTDSSLPFRPQTAAGTGAMKLDLPKRSQIALNAPHSRDICSPVSLSMVLAGLGKRSPALHTAAAVRDKARAIFGNWFFNTAYAGSLGLHSVLTRLNSLDEARAYIEAGVPVIASLTFGPGGLRGAPLKRTSGHLMAITGFAGNGDVVVNDPAAPDNSTVERVYNRRQFEEAWLGNKFGLSYIVTEDLGRFLAVKWPYAELYETPPGGRPGRRKLIESQLLLNERVELAELSGRWARVRACEQKSLRADGRTLAPYEGWTEAAALAFRPPLPPDSVVKAKTASSGGRSFSLGVKLNSSLPERNPSARSLNRLTPPAPAVLRRGALRTARLFLGDKYYWGGRSAWGVDCSGLVSLAFRAWGVDLPRNAGDQFYASRRIARAELLPGDLIFSSDASEPMDITHVMLYSGRGSLIEATGDSNSVREVSFKKKFGVPFRAAENAMVAGGKKIFFRRVIEP